MSSNVVDACWITSDSVTVKSISDQPRGLDVCFEITRAIRASTHEVAHESRLAAQSGPSKFLRMRTPHCARVMLAGSLGVFGVCLGPKLDPNS